MNLTYEEFIKLIPKETKEFTDSVLPFFDRYLKEDMILRIKKSSCYVDEYCIKNNLHLSISLEEIVKIEQNLKSLNPENDMEYANFLQATSQLQIMMDKRNRFATSNQLMKQELFRVNQAIVNHFITINALEMARDDLFPLIGSELFIMQGKDNEKNAIDLSHNVINLFQSLLTRNTNCTIENIEKLKQLNLPSSIYQSLNQDIESYLNELKQANIMLDYTKNNESTDENIQESKSKKLKME